MRPPLEDGIYIDLPMEEYVADPALSGSAFFKLLSDPGALQWESPDNPLWEERPSKPQARGSAAHCAILEGFEAYEAGFIVPPEGGGGVLKSSDEMGEWLRELKASGRPGFEKLKVSGSKDELRARIMEVRAGIAEDDEFFPRFWDELVGDRQVIAAADDAYVRLLHRFVHSDPHMRGCVTGGLPEVSIIMTLDGRRLKCRADYLNAASIVDVKTYGRPPMRGRGLRGHLIREAYYNGYDLQAVHNHGLCTIALQAFAAGKLAMVQRRDSGADALTMLRDIAAAWNSEPPVFRWLWLRMHGALSGIVVPFRTDDPRWPIVEDDIDAALQQYDRYREACGAGPWLTCAGEQEIDSLDWPAQAFEVRES